MKPSPGTRKSIPLAQAMPATLSWAASVNANVITQGKPLSAWQAADAMEVGVMRPDAVRILRVPVLPQPDCPHFCNLATQSGLDLGGSAGMALGYAVLICHRALGDRRVLRHELRHVAQFEQSRDLGRFLDLYLAQIAQHGYRDAPLEVDARRHEGLLTIPRIDIPSSS
jgi:hypothetical protein